MRNPQAVKFIVVPYRQISNGALQPVEMRQASTEVGAIRVAQSMATTFAGVAAYEVEVDDETGAMNAPRILFQEGTIPALDD